MVQNNSYSKVVSIHSRWVQENRDTVVVIASGDFSEAVAVNFTAVAAREPILRIVETALKNSRKPHPNPSLLQKEVLENAANEIVRIVKTPHARNIFTDQRDAAAREILQALTTATVTKQNAETVEVSRPTPAIIKPKKPTAVKTVSSKPTPLTVASHIKQSL